MKKLRIILQSKKVIVLIIVVTIFRMTLALNNMSYCEEKLGEGKVINGIIKNVNIAGDKKTLEVNDTIIYTSGEFRFGERVECTGQIILPSENTNFYLFNYRRFLLSKKIYYQMNAKCVIVGGSSNPLYKIKNALVNLSNSRKSRAYIKSFLLGNTKEIDSAVMASYRKNGVSHLFAISGMHITLIIAIASLFKLTRRNTVVVFPFLLFYLFLVNYPPSMLRAVSFFILVNINRKTGLNLKNIYLFLYLTVFFVFYNPYFLYSTGFIYSFTITFFLILYSDIFKTEKNSIKKTFLLSFIIFLVSIPINIQNNFYINLLSPLYNLFFVPIISLFLFPGAFLVLIFPILDNLYSLCWMGMENLSMFLSSINSILILCWMEWYVIGWYYVIIIFIIHKIRLKEYIYIVLIFIVLSCHHLYPYVRNKAIVLMLDVGQGDSILIIYPYSRFVLLIDTGGNPFSNRIASDITIPTLYSLGITKINYLVLTHGDNDHVGEAINILKHVKTDSVLLNSGSLTSDEIDIIHYMDLNVIDYELISKTMIKHNGIELEFLNSSKKNDENEDSLVLLLEINKKRILLMGDSGIKTEREILSEYNLATVDILKIGHHGSKYSSDQQFIDVVSPEIALISVGASNRYGHPHPEVLNKLQFCDTYITSVDGAIRIVIGKSMLVTKVR